tara:strand:+ start:1695 stop:2486 length:792 start_codon:yes stop_codon:yes gene_type:complete
MIYIFYQNYRKENEIVQQNILIEDDFNASIEKNNNQIKNISTEINETKSSLIEIEKVIKSLSSKKSEQEFANINKNMEVLTQNIKYLSEEIKKIKNNDTILNPEIIDDGTSDVINLILIKYENNSPLNSEIDYLKKIYGNKKPEIFEKIEILLLKPYNGHIYLENLFTRESDDFFKNKIKNKSNFFISEIFLPYVTISPSSENNVDEDSIKLIKELKNNIKNNKIISAYDKINNAKDLKESFSKSLKEMQKYIEFKLQLNKLI